MSKPYKKIKLTDNDAVVISVVLTFFQTVEANSTLAISDKKTCVMVF
ncbi:MAG: hypothetical protein J0L94_01415 [Rhodothermia bacterium]|nr:hypothetical protein [Rhodothermia bacterium]